MICPCPSVCSSSTRCAPRLDTELPTWWTQRSTSRTLQGSSSSRAAPISSSSRPHFWTRMRSLPRKGALSLPRRRARLQEMPGLPASCHSISLPATTAERTNCGGSWRRRGADDRSRVSASCTALRRPSLHQVDREREHDGGAAFARDIEQGCQIAQLHGLRHRRQDLRGLEQLLCRLLLSLRIDDLGATGPFGLGLTGDRPDHALVEIDALDLHGGHLDAPRFGLLVEHVLDIGVELVALGQHLVEVVLAQHPTQRGLRELAGCKEIVIDLNDRTFGVDYGEIDHRIHLA